MISTSLDIAIRAHWPIFSCFMLIHRARVTAWKNCRACSLIWPRVSSTQIGLIPHITIGLLPTSLPNWVKSPLRIMRLEVPVEVDARHIPWPEQTHIYSCLISTCIEETHFASLSAQSLGPPELDCCLFKEKSSNF